MTTPTAVARASRMPRASLIIAFTIGAIAGPMLTGALGLTVTSRTAGTRMQDSLLELKGQVCEARARGEVTAPERLDATARRMLATKHAQTQPSGAADDEIIGVCSRKLAG